MTAAEKKDQLKKAKIRIKDDQERPEYQLCS